MARTGDKYAKIAVPPMPSARELRAMMKNTEFGVDPSVPRRTARGGRNEYAMTGDQAIAAASLMDRSQVISPLAGLPVSASSGDFAYARAMLGNATSGSGEWDDYWQDDQSGYDYENQAGQIVYDDEGEVVREIPGYSVTRNKDIGGRTREPAPISVMPTSTINPDRPRTVAAGYSVDRAVLTVVFRDGTFYNYYDVEESTWGAFKSAVSKGRFIAGTLDYYGRGTANMAKAPVYAREQVVRVARAGQLTYAGSDVQSFNPKTGNLETYSGVSPTMQTDRSLPPRVNPTASRRRTSASKGGKNPAKNGMRKAT